MTNEEIIEAEVSRFISGNPVILKAVATAVANRKDREFESKAREWFQLNAWAFAHAVDGEPIYDDTMAMKSFFEKLGLDL